MGKSFLQNENRCPDSILLAAKGSLKLISTLTEVMAYVKNEILIVQAWTYS